MPKSGPTQEELLVEIQATLDELKALFVLANQDKLEKEKERLLPEGSVKKAIYDLCDATRGTAEIAQEIERYPTYPGSYLTRMRREGLIRTVEKDGKIVHEQIF